MQFNFKITKEEQPLLYKEVFQWYQLFLYHIRNKGYTENSNYFYDNEGRAICTRTENDTLLFKKYGSGENRNSYYPLFSIKKENDCFYIERFKDDSIHSVIGNIFQKIVALKESLERTDVNLFFDGTLDLFHIEYIVGENRAFTEEEIQIKKRIEEIEDNLSKDISIRFTRNETGLNLLIGSSYINNEESLDNFINAAKKLKIIFKTESYFKNKEKSSL